MNLSSINLRFFANVAPLIGGLNKAERAMQNSARSMQKLGGNLTMKLTAPVVAFGAVAFNTFREFEFEMQKVKAVSGATGEEFESLKNSALELGRTTVFSASDVAKLQTEFAKLGFTAPQIDGVTASTLNLAQATDTELGRAAEVVGSTLRGFQMDVSQTGHIADVMAKSFSTSGLDMEKFAESMKYVAPIANSAGVSIEETTAMIGLLSNAGISGSQAGTALRRIISELGTGSEPVTEKIKQLADAGIGLADAKDEVGRAAQNALLVLAGSADQIDPMTESLVNADGAAQDMSDTMNDSTEGAMKEFNSAWEGLKISAGEDFAEAAEPVVEILGDFFNWFTDLPGPIRTTTLVVAGLGAAIGPIIWLIGSFQSALVSLRTATWLSTGATSAWGTVTAIATSPITLVILGITALAAILTYLAYNFDTVKAVSINALKYMANMGIKVLNPLIETFNAVADALGFDKVKINTFKEFEYETVPALKGVGQVVSEIKKNLGYTADEAKGVTEELGKLAEITEELDDIETDDKDKDKDKDKDIKRTTKEMRSLNDEVERLSSLEAQFNAAMLQETTDALQETIQPLDAVVMGLEDLNDLDLEEAPVFQDVPKGFAKMKLAAIEMSNAISDSMRSMAIDTVVGLSEMAGAMMVGQATFADFGMFIVGQFASLFTEIGKMFVEYGFAQIAFNAAVGAMQGPGAIAAGVALLALAGAMKGRMKSISEGSGIPAMAEGGIVTGPTLALIGEGRGPEAVIPLDKLDGFMGGGAQNINVTGRIQGSDILLSQERATRERSRYRGY